MSVNFNLHGNHIEITPALKKYATAKLTKVEQFIDRITSINVILSVDNRAHKAEAEVKIAGDQNSIFAEAITDDLYKSIDLLEDKLAAQVKKYIEKNHSHGKK